VPVLLWVAIAVILIAVFFTATGRGGELAYEHADHAPLNLGSVSGADVALLRPPTALWGYNMQVTDAALDTIAQALRDRDVTIAHLHQQLTDLTYHVHGTTPAPPAGQDFPTRIDEGFQPRPFPGRHEAPALTPPEAWLAPAEAPAAEDLPDPLVWEAPDPQSLPSPEDRPWPSSPEEQATPSPQDQSWPTLQDQAWPTPQDQPSPAAEGEVPLAVRDQPSPAAEGEVPLAVRDQPPPAAEAEVPLAVRDQPSPAAEAEVPLAVQDQAWTPPQDEPSPVGQGPGADPGSSAASGTSDLTPGSNAAAPGHGPSGAAPDRPAADGGDAIEQG
jgi:hypothetical protein